jgi:cyclic pyranopterin phosphate synthase
MESTSDLTHFNEQGRARMVDVSDKAPTKRSATATSCITMKSTTLELIKQGKLKKGDVLAVAQVAGIMAAKRTSEWIPMCHPIALTGVDIQFADNGENELYIEATVRTNVPTGVEMEALTAVSAAAITVYDMCKAVEKDMVISSTMLLAKTGGKSGDFSRNDPNS